MSLVMLKSKQEWKINSNEKNERNEKGITGNSKFETHQEDHTSLKSGFKRGKKTDANFQVHSEKQ